MSKFKLNLLLIKVYAEIHISINKVYYFSHKNKDTIVNVFLYVCMYVKINNQFVCLEWKYQENLNSIFITIVIQSIYLFTKEITKK